MHIHDWTASNKTSTVPWLSFEKLAMGVCAGVYIILLMTSQVYLCEYRKLGSIFHSCSYFLHSHLWL